MARALRDGCDHLGEEMGYSAKLVECVPACLPACLWIVMCRVPGFPPPTWYLPACLSLRGSMVADGEAALPCFSSPHPPFSPLLPCLALR